MKFDREKMREAVLRVASDPEQLHVGWTVLYAEAACAEAERQFAAMPPRSGFDYFSAMGPEGFSEIAADEADAARGKPAGDLVERLKWLPRDFLYQLPDGRITEAGANAHKAAAEIEWLRSSEAYWKREAAWHIAHNDANAGLNTASMAEREKAERLARVAGLREMSSRIEEIYGLDNSASRLLRAEADRIEREGV